LLVNWMVRLAAAGPAAQSDSWKVIFVPISIRFNTNRPAIFYEAIAARLAELLETDLRPPQSDPVAYYEDQCQMLIKRIASRQLRTLIIIDGADESLGDNFEARWFPRQGQGILRLLVSARLQIGDVDAQGWVRRLGWEYGIRYRSLELPRLGVDGVKDLLITTGAPLDVLAARPDIIGKLHRLSEGEPLVLRLYVEDLWARGPGSQELTVEDLDHIEPGLAGYFEEWLSRQQVVWREERKDGALVDGNLLGTQLALLACAHGPLATSDIGELLRRCGCQNSGVRIEDGLYPLRRFVIGTGRHPESDADGYVLSHPRFGQFLREEYLDESQIADVRAVLAGWGADVVRRTNDGQLSSGQVPSYILNYHSQHLVDAARSSDYFMTMLELGWLRAREAHEGGYRGFSEDVAATTNALIHEKPQAATWRSSLVRCALFQTSVASLVSQMSEDVLLPCVKFRLLTVRQALHWLDFQPRYTRDDFLVGLAPLLDETDAGAALEACRSIDYAMGRARALSAIIPRLAERDRQAIATEVLSILIEQGIHSGNLRAWETTVGETLAAIAKYLDAAEIALATTVAAAMSYNKNRFFSYLALGAAAPVDERRPLLRQAISALSGVQDKQERHMLLAQLTPYMTLELLYPVIEAVSENESNGWQHYIDELIAPLPEPYRILAFEAAIRLESQPARYEVAARILRQVPKDQHALALLTSLTYIREPSGHFRLLSNLSFCITGSIVPIVLRHARALLDDHGVAEAIAQMMPGLSENLADLAGCGKNPCPNRHRFDSVPTDRHGCSKRCVERTVRRASCSAMQVQRAWFRKIIRCVPSAR
jgi:hypothetical protein